MYLLNPTSGIREKKSEERRAMPPQKLDKENWKKMWTREIQLLLDKLRNELRNELRDEPRKEPSTQNLPKTSRENADQGEVIRVRLQVWLEEPHGYRQQAVPHIHRLTEVSVLKQHQPAIKLVYVPVQTISRFARPAHLKLSNMLHYRAAFREAAARGADDGILTNKEGFLAETAISNLFWLRDDTVYTPSPDMDILPGITRNKLVKALREEGTNVVEGAFQKAHLEKADAVWTTNSLREIVPVYRIGDRSWAADHEMISLVRQCYDQLKRREGAYHA